MNDLHAWKEALQKHGIKCEKKKAIDVLLVFGLGGEVLAVTDDDDDHSAAEFISRVTEFAFGEWFSYVPLPSQSDEYRWELYTREHRPNSSDKDTYHGSGPNKRGALLHALQTKEPK